MKINIDPTGKISMIYSDDLVEFLHSDQVTNKSMKRVSRVEPKENGRWSVDMSPVGGEKYGDFKLRRDALNSEVAWLCENYFNDKCIAKENKTS